MCATGAWRRAITATALLGSLTTHAVAADVFGGAEFAFSTGDFGTDVDSSMSTLSLSASVVKEALDATVIVPFVTLDTDGADSSGLGDITLRAGINSAARAGATTTHAAVAIKLPTASEEDGLGTGELDIGLFGGATWPVGKVKASLSAGYIMMGDAPEFDYENVLMLSAGILRNYARSGAWVSLDYRSAMIDGGDDPLELSGGLFTVLDARNALIFSAFLGLSDGSADLGGSAGITHRF